MKNYEQLRINMNIRSIKLGNMDVIFIKHGKDIHTIYINI